MKKTNNSRKGINKKLYSPENRRLLPEVKLMLL